MNCLSALKLKGAIEEADLLGLDNKAVRDAKTRYCPLSLSLDASLSTLSLSRCLSLFALRLTLSTTVMKVPRRVRPARRPLGRLPER